MGGAQGRLFHPWDDTTLTLADLCKLFGMAFGTQSTNPVFEKYDGINMLFKWDSRESELVYARSMTDLRSGGIRLEQVLTRFKDDPDVGETMHSAMKALSDAFNENIRDADLLTYEKHWHSCDVLSRKHMNVIRYDVDSIAVHPIWISESEGILFSNLRELSYGGVTNGWNIVPPTYWVFLGRNDVLTKAISKTMSLPYTLGLPFNATTLGEIYLHDVRHQAHLAGIPAHMINKVTSRIVKVPGYMNLTELKKMVRYDSEIPIIQKFVKDELSVMKKAQSIVEKIVIEFSIGLMANVGSDLIEDEQVEIERLRNVYTESSNKLYDTRFEFLREQHRRLGDDEKNINSALEGVIVYDSENKAFFKLTGWFAPINQVLGILRFGR